jgi:hypothetical protein
MIMMLSVGWDQRGSFPGRCWNFLFCPEGPGSGVNPSWYSNHKNPGNEAFDFRQIPRLGILGTIPLLPHTPLCCWVIFRRMQST